MSYICYTNVHCNLLLDFLLAYWSPIGSYQPGVRVALLVHDNSFCLASWKNFPGRRSSQSAACIQDSWRPAYLLGSDTNLTLTKPFQNLAAWNLAAAHDQKLKVSDRLIDYIDYSLDSLTTHLSKDLVHTGCEFPRPF